MVHGFIFFVDKSDGKPRAHLRAHKTCSTFLRLQEFRVPVFSHEENPLRTDLGAYLTFNTPGVINFYGALGNFTPVAYLLFAGIFSHHQ